MVAVVVCASDYEMMTMTMTKMFDDDETNLFVMMIVNDFGVNLMEDLECIFCIDQVNPLLDRWH